MKWPVTVGAVFGILISIVSHLGDPAFSFSHGLNTTFDPNSFGGNWTCFLSLASGKCGGATTQYFNATCDGSADDTAANASFRTYAAAHSPVNLYIPPGSKCNITYDGTFSFTSGATNLVVWAYGVTFTTTGGILALGGAQAFVQDNVHQALIADANAGDTTVTVTDGNIGRFKQKDWAAVTGPSLQNGGYPPNFAFFDYKQIINCGTTDGAACISATFTLDSALFNSYKSTWPTVSSGPPSGGPATIFDLDQTWNINLQWFGGGLTSSIPGQQVAMLGRAVAVYDLNLQGTLQANLTVSKTVSCTRCIFNGGIEIDKENENLTLNYVSTGQISNFSMNRNVTFNHVTTINGGSLNGTNRFMTIQNSDFSRTNPSADIGTPGFGHSETLTLDSSNMGAFACSAQAIQVGWVTYGSGTFTIATADANRPSIVAWAVPGYQYFFATVAGNIVNLGKTFTVTGLRQDATNTYVDTDLVGSLPSLGQTHYVAQPAPTVTATNMTGSSAPSNASGAWCHL